MVDKDIVKSGYSVASWIGCSPHEWVWTQKDQECMAKTIIILAGALNDINDIIQRKEWKNGKLQQCVSFIAENYKVSEEFVEPKYLTTKQKE